MRKILLNEMELSLISLPSDLSLLAAASCSRYHLDPSIITYYYGTITEVLVQYAA